MAKGKSKTVIAIACADIHLSLTPPIARAGEDWFGAMSRQLAELEKVRGGFDASATWDGIPILCAGDIFDRWQSPPELINFAISNLPKMMAIPGQHDLPYHSEGGMSRSAYGTLVAAGTIQHIDVPRTFGIHKVYGFGWGREITPPPPNPEPNGLNIAMVHAYTYIPGTSYKDLPPDRALSKVIEKFAGYDTVIIGDNHISWDYSCAGINVFNCGGFYRRNGDQGKHRPRIGLIYSDGTVGSHYLDCSKDILTSAAGDTLGAEASMTLAKLKDHLKSLQGATLDYKAAMRQTMARQSTPEPVRMLVEEAFESAGKDR